MQKWITGLFITVFIGLAAYVFLARKTAPVPPPFTASTEVTAKPSPLATPAVATKPAMIPAPAASAPTSALEDLYKGKTKTVDAKLLEKIKAELNPSKMQQLASWSTDIQLSSQTRQSALYVLTQMGEEAIPALTTVATTPLQAKVSRDAHSVGSYHYSEDVGIRITAIEALDNNIHRADLILPAMQMVLNTHKEQSLLLLAQISISGIQSGHPGKVQRAVEAMLKGNK